MVYWCLVLSSGLVGRVWLGQVRMDKVVMVSVFTALIVELVVEGCCQTWGVEFCFSLRSPLF